MIRTQGEAGTGDVVEAVRHARAVLGEIRRRGRTMAPEENCSALTPKKLAPVERCAKLKPSWAACRWSTLRRAGSNPADAALMMQLGMDRRVFVGPASSRAATRPNALPPSSKPSPTTTTRPILAEVSRNLGEPMVGRNVSTMPEMERIAGRGWSSDRL